jgi:hypothetical protein
MAAAGRALEGEFGADVQAQSRLVVNAYERYLTNLNDGEPAGRCYLLVAPGPRTACVSAVARSPCTGQELPRDGEIAAHWVSIFPGAEACPKQPARKWPTPEPNPSIACPCRATNAVFKKWRSMLDRR